MNRPFEPAILVPGSLPSADRGNGARTTPLVTGALGATSFINGITAFEPGAAIGHHTHNCVESVMVIEGDAVVNIDGVETALEVWDTTFVPANIPHHFRNTSQTKPMRIFWTYASLDATRTMVETGASGRVDGEHGGEAGKPSHILEIAEIIVKRDSLAAFEEVLVGAGPLFQSGKGCRTWEVVRSNEEPEHYLLLIEWDTIADHKAFIGTPGHVEWRKRIDAHVDSRVPAQHWLTVAKGF